MSMERRTFYGPDINLEALAQALVDFFARDRYRTQMMPVHPAGFMVQAAKEDALRKISGTDTALTAVLNLEGEYVAVDLGGAKWADKGLVAGVGALLFFPVLITAGIGTYNQTHLQNDVWQFIEQYIHTHSKAGPGPQGVAQAKPPAPPPPAAGVAGVCAQCKQPLPPGSKFCNACGAAVSSACKSCGAALPAGARFCNQCGSPVVQ